jgi:hypothetical protein
MAKSFIELLNADNVVGYVENAREVTPMAGADLFPNRAIDGLTFEWIETNTGSPRLLRASGWDAKAEPITKAGDVKRYGGEMTFFKNVDYISEKTRQELIKAFSSSITTWAERLLIDIYDGATDMISAAHARLEKLRMDMLQTGAIVRDDIIDDELVFIDYNTEETNAQRITVELDNTTDFFDEIEKLIAKIYENGKTKPTRALVNSSFFGMFRRNETILNYIHRNYERDFRSVVTDDQIRMYFSDMFNLSIFVYDGTYTNSKDEEVTYIKDGNFILLPNGAVGRTNTGTTPEEADLLGAVGNSSVRILDGFIAVTTGVDADPVLPWTKVSMVAAPSFESIKKVGMVTFVPKFEALAQRATVAKKTAAK